MKFEVVVPKNATGGVQEDEFQTRVSYRFTHLQPGEKYSISFWETSACDRDAPPPRPLGNKPWAERAPMETASMYFLEPLPAFVADPDGTLQASIVVRGRPGRVELVPAITTLSIGAAPISYSRDSMVACGRVEMMKLRSGWHLIRVHF
ncbi:hypothetical protein [Ramlibacter sp. AN1133]|uniref:hypothetical protein n=1 Tax=Ramlibacter sp. AN1133 TaxID=3133429 RepID=UPI0030BB869C